MEDEGKHMTTIITHIDQDEKHGKVNTNHDINTCSQNQTKGQITEDQFESLSVQQLQELLNNINNSA